MSILWSPFTIISIMSSSGSDRIIDMAEEDQREDQEDVRGGIMGFAFLRGYEGDIFQRH
jgi:hypothetical protein